MGLRTGAYASVWSVEPVSDTLTKARISISRKNKASGEYEQDFGGYVSFVGTLAAKKAASLQERDRIKLGDVDVTNRFDKEKNVTYTNFKIFSFEMADDALRNPPPPSQNRQDHFNVDDGVVDDDIPF